MTPRGAAPLVAMRMSGQVPSADVLVNHGDLPEPDWWKWANSCDKPEILIRPEDPIERLDLRCIVGLRITLFMAQYSDKAALLFERLQEYATEIVALSPDFEGDLGMWWLPKYGVIDFDKRPVVTAYEAAKANTSIAAHKRDEAGYRASQAEEMNLLEANPWLR